VSRTLSNSPDTLNILPLPGKEIIKTSAGLQGLNMSVFFDLSDNTIAFITCWSVYEKYIYICRCMKNGKIISSLLSLLLSIAVLTGSTGFSLLIRECSMCGDISVSLPAEPAANEDGCCGMTEDACTPAAYNNEESGCCHFSIENYKLVNFKPAVIFELPVIEAPISYLTPFDFREKSSQILLPIFAMNKHGGQELFILNHQLKS